MVPDLLVLLLVPDGVAQVILRHLGGVSTLQELESTTTRRSGERDTDAGQLTEVCCNHPRSHRPSRHCARAGGPDPALCLYMALARLLTPPLSFCSMFAAPRLALETTVHAHGSRICHSSFPHLNSSDVRRQRLLALARLACPTPALISSCAKHGTPFMIRLHRRRR